MFSLTELESKKLTELRGLCKTHKVRVSGDKRSKHAYIKALLTVDPWEDLPRVPAGPGLRVPF